jgi:hypothetical protein
VRENLPDDMPDRQKLWNSLKVRRERRNNYDYTLYPPEAGLLAQHCAEAVEEAKSFLGTCREYLVTRGVQELPGV